MICLCFDLFCFFINLQSDHRIRNQPRYLTLAATHHCYPTKEPRDRYHYCPTDNRTLTSPGTTMLRENKQSLLLENVSVHWKFVLNIILYIIVYNIYFIFTEDSYNNPQDGYFLLRPSTTKVRNPFVLVLWYKDRVYNVPVRKRNDNR